MENMRYDDEVVIVTGAGNGLGRQYALFFASRGAKVVVNDLGGDIRGSSKSTNRESHVADAVVKEIQENGGCAVADYHAVQEGASIVKTAIDKFGRIDVLINNAGILRDTTLRKMTDADWDIIMDVHLHGAMQTTRAAWPYFKSRKYGRIINTTSASGIWGNFGQSNYAAAKMALVGFSETLAKEGTKYNITCNVIAPAAASRLTQTVWPPEMMQAMRPEWVVPIVGVLCHSSCLESGAIFEAGAGHFSKIRWERSQGWYARPEDVSPGLIARYHDKIVDWENADHPSGPPDRMKLLEKSRAQPWQGVVSDQAYLSGKVALVTGAANGLGRAYAIELAKHGAKVAVCDIKNASLVVDEIKRTGGEAVAIKRSVTEAEAIVDSTMTAFGRIDILINNAGILRDKSFQKMSNELWFSVIEIHLRATYKLTKAVWPLFMRQKYGRIVNTTSQSGIYGNFGQANYAAAKCGVIGFSKSIAREGSKYNIIVNTIAPAAATNLSGDVLSAEEKQSLSPHFIAPLVLMLCSQNPPTTGHLYEVGPGWAAATRWQRTKGVNFPFANRVPSVEEVSQALPEIRNFDDGEADNPESPEDGAALWMANLKDSGAVSRGSKL